MTIAICGPSGKRVYAGPATAYALIARPTVRSRSPQCDPIAKQTNLQVISRIVSDDMMLEAGPVATGGNAGPSMQPADMPMVADQTSPPRKQLRQDDGGSGPDLSAIHAGGNPIAQSHENMAEETTVERVTRRSARYQPQATELKQEIFELHKHSKIPVITL